MGISVNPVLCPVISWCTSMSDLKRWQALHSLQTYSLSNISLVTDGIPEPPDGETIAVAYKIYGIIVGGSGGSLTCDILYCVNKLGFCKRFHYEFVYIERRHDLLEFFLVNHKRRH
jgi:hypothetical protein